MGALPINYFPDIGVIGKMQPELNVLSARIIYFN